MVPPLQTGPGASNTLLRCSKHQGRCHHRNNHHPTSHNLATARSRHRRRLPGFRRHARLHGCRLGHCGSSIDIHGGERPQELRGRVGRRVGGVAHVRKGQLAQCNGRGIRKGEAVGGISRGLKVGSVEGGVSGVEDAFMVSNDFVGRL